jgi:hypothetical protein
MTSTRLKDHCRRFISRLLKPHSRFVEQTGIPFSNRTTVQILQIQQ